MLFNCHDGPSVLWDIFEKFHSTQPSKQNNIEVSEQVTIQKFRNTTTMLQYIYFTYMKQNLSIFTCSETVLKPATQYCRDRVSNEQENTTRIA